MTKRGLVEIGIKLVGVYCFVQFLQFLPSLPMAFLSTGMDEYVRSKALYVALVCVYPLIHLILAYMFVMKTHVVLGWLRFSGPEEEAADQPEAPVVGQISFWIRIIGIYYFVSSAASVAAHIPSLAFDYSRSSTPIQVMMAGRGLWPELLILALSLIFIFKNQVVENFIIRKQAQDTPPEE